MDILTARRFSYTNKYHVIYPNTARSFEENHGFIASNDAINNTFMEAEQIKGQSVNKIHQ